MKAEMKKVTKETISAAKTIVGLALFLEFMRNVALAMVLALIAFGITIAVAAAPVALLVFGIVSAALIAVELVRTIVAAIIVNKALDVSATVIDAGVEATMPEKTSSSSTQKQASKAPVVTAHQATAATSTRGNSLFPAFSARSVATADTAPNLASLSL